MVYNKTLPKIENIIWLTRLAKPFPATAGLILDRARLWDLSPGTISFLQLFPRDVLFNSVTDFITRCEQLELLILEARHAPQETLRSPQG